MYEYTTMQRLYQAGAAVPTPIAAGENAILMGYYGDERRAAPTLSEVSLARGEARPLFQEALRNIELLLQHNLIHGDLSAYNILYWQGRIVLIDFPQVVSLQANSSGAAILHRDVTRICEYFARQGVACNPDARLLTICGCAMGRARKMKLKSALCWPMPSKTKHYEHPTSPLLEPAGSLPPATAIPGCRPGAAGSRQHRASAGQPADPARLYR